MAATLKTVKVFTKRHITRQKIILQSGGMRKARKLLYLLVTIMLETCIDSILFIFVDFFAPFLLLFFTYLHLSDRMVYLKCIRNRGTRTLIILIVKPLPRRKTEHYLSPERLKMLLERPCSRYIDLPFC